jgi:hypothetical protein
MTSIKMCAIIMTIQLKLVLSDVARRSTRSDPRDGAQASEAPAAASA